MISKSLLYCNIRAIRPMASRMLHAGPVSRNMNALRDAFKTGDDDDDAKTYKPKKIPNVLGLHKRWEKLNLAQQEEVIAYLETKQQENWKTLTNDEKKALWYIYFGPWGPRSSTEYDPGAFYGGIAKAVGGIIIGVCCYKAYDVYSEPQQQI